MHRPAITRLTNLATKEEKAVIRTRCFGPAARRPVRPPSRDAPALDVPRISSRHRHTTTGRRSRPPSGGATFLWGRCVVIRVAFFHLIWRRRRVVSRFGVRQCSRHVSEGQSEKSLQQPLEVAIQFYFSRGHGFPVSKNRAQLVRGRAATFGPAIPKTEGSSLHLAGTAPQRNIGNARFGSTHRRHILLFFPSLRRQADTTRESPAPAMGPKHALRQRQAEKDGAARNRSCPKAFERSWVACILHLRSTGHPARKGQPR